MGWCRLARPCDRGVFPSGGPSTDPNRPGLRKMPDAQGKGPPLFLPSSFFIIHERFSPLSVQASIQHASGVSSAGWSAPTPQSAACVGPTSPRRYSLTGRSLQLRKDRKPASVPPPCPLPCAGDCKYQRSSRGRGNRRSRALPPHHPHHPHRPQVVGVSVSLCCPNPKRHP